MSAPGTQPNSAISPPVEVWRRMALLLGPLALLAVYWLPMPGLSIEAHKLAAVLVLVFIYWVSEAIPLPATALLGAALCIVLGVAEDRKVMAPFANPITFLFIGSFILAQSMQKYGLDRRLALNVLSLPLVARSTWTMFAALGLMTATLSMWMSNLATTAVMAPIALGILRASPQFDASDRAKANQLLMIAFAASVGGLATPVGTPPNLIALGFIEQLVDEQVSFFRWLQLGVPLAAVLMVFLIWLLRPPGGVRFHNHQELTAAFRNQRAALGLLSRGEINTNIAFGTAITLWMYPGLVELIFDAKRFGASFLVEHFPEETVGLIAGLMLFALPTNLKKWEFTMTWREATKIDWGTILLFGGGLALGKQIFDTGLAKAVGELVNTSLGSPGLWTITAVGIVLSILLSEATSNTASANVMVPMMIAVAQAAHVNPVPVAIATCMACSFGFMLPVSTGPNAFVYGTGLVPMRLMIRHGVYLDIAGAITIWLIVRLLGPPLGWH